MEEGSLGAVVTRGLPALRRQFPHVDEEALELLAGEGKPDEDATAALAEMQRDALAEAAAGRGVGGAGGSLPTRGCAVALAAGAAGSSSRRGGECLELQFEGGSDPPRCGTVLLIDGLSSCAGAETWSGAMALPTGEVLALESHTGSVCFRICDYGMHELRLRADGGQVLRRRFMSTSHLGDFAQALDHFHDSCDWVWDGQWTEELEDATMELLSALDDHFAATEASLRQAPMGSTVMSELGPSRRRLEAALAKVLEGHDAQSMGRVYGAVRSFLSSRSLLGMFGPMMGGGAGGPAQPDEASLYDCVVAFEKARHGAASDAKRAEVKAALSNLILASDAYVAELDAGQPDDFARRWHGGLRDVLVHMRDDADAVIHPKPFQQLRGEGGGYIADMMKSVMESFNRPSGKVARAETIEGVTMLSPQESFGDAQSRVSRWVESLVDESVGFGSPMAPFEVHEATSWVPTVFASITSLLSLGLGYVTSGEQGAMTSKLISLLDRDRATLPLDGLDEFLLDRKRKDRLKDVARVIRALRRRGQRLSLSVNTDFKGALEALKAHHADNWVGVSLEAIWNRMMPEGRVFAFELWLHEPAENGAAAPAPRLVAADFGHAHTFGRAYYVATRVFDREYRTLQPGFVLAFAEAECLKRAGFKLWDLGGADKSPMMQYKPQVAVEMGRSDFLRRLRECSRAAEAEAAAAGEAVGRPELPLSESGACPPYGGNRVPTGVIFNDISEDELWGAKELQVREAEERRREAEAAKQRQAAAGRAGKPPKQAKGPKQGASKAAPPAAAAAADGAAAAKPSAPFQPAAREATAAAAAPTNGNAAATPGAGADAATKSGSSPSPGAGAGAGAGGDSGGEDAKAAAKRRFMEAFQRLVAEGVSQEDAAARALQLVAAAKQ